MAQGRKIIKLPDGNAFIEIGEDYVRIGVGNKTFLLMDDKTITAGGDAMNYQMSPGKVTYQGILAQQSDVIGLLPVSPKYKINSQIIRALINTGRTFGEISRSIGI